jgi:ornithine decarboxylase
MMVDTKSPVNIIPPFEFPRPAEEEEAQTGINIPRAVINKFDVECVSGTLEELVARKIQEDNGEEDAFYLVDLGTVLQKYEQWVRCLPRVKPFYAVKCNPNSAILRTLANLGVNFDCASRTEIQKMLGIGVSSKRILYANPTKMKSHIKYAKGCGVEMMTFDNSDELYKIAECYPEAKLILRIITDDSKSICKFSTKFGAPLSQVFQLLELAKELNLNVIGVSFHVGSGCMSVQSFADAIMNASEVFKEGEKLGFNMTMLDLGGGWPGTDNDCSIQFSEIANHIRPIIDEYFPPHIEVIAEPGRYFVAESHTLVVNVFAKRTVPDKENAEDKHFLYYVNDGVYQSFNCIFFDHCEPKPIVMSSSGADRSKQYKCTIFGPTCDSMDCIGKDLLLPELQIGDWLYFKHMGAYTVAAASSFNGFKQSPTTYYIHHAQQ